MQFSWWVVFGHATLFITLHRYLLSRGMVTEPFITCYNMDTRWSQAKQVDYEGEEWGASSEQDIDLDSEDHSEQKVMSREMLADADVERDAMNLSQAPPLDTGAEKNHDISEIPGSQPANDSITRALDPSSIHLSAAEPHTTDLDTNPPPGDTGIEENHGRDATYKVAIENTGAAYSTWDVDSDASNAPLAHPAILALVDFNALGETKEPSRSLFESDDVPHATTNSLANQTMPDTDLYHADNGKVEPDWNRQRDPMTPNEEMRASTLASHASESDVTRGIFPADHEHRTSVDEHGDYIERHQQFKPMKVESDSKFQEVISPVTPRARTSFRFDPSAEPFVTRRTILAIPECSAKVNAFETARSQLASKPSDLKLWLTFLSTRLEIPLHALSSPEQSAVALASANATWSGVKIISGGGSGRTAAASVNAAKGVWAGVKKGGKAISIASHHVGKIRDSGHLK